MDMKPLTAGHARRLRYAGYTHYFQFEIWLPMLGVWTQSGYPTTADALAAHISALGLRERAREVRNVTVIDLQDV